MCGAPITTHTVFVYNGEDVLGRLLCEMELCLLFRDGCIPGKSAKQKVILSPVRMNENFFSAIVHWKAKPYSEVVGSIA